jgi:hypothetical protein
MTKDRSDDRRDRLAKWILGNLSKEGLAYSRRCEYIKGYPGATEAQIDLLMAAEKKNGSVPWNLLHAREIMTRDNLWAFVPPWNSPFGGSPGNRWIPPRPSAAVKAEERNNPRPVYTTPLDD